MKKPILLTLGLCLQVALHAQPYVDLINIRYLNSPDAGLWRRDQVAGTLQYWNVSTTLPIKLKGSKDLLVLSPYMEHWRVRNQAKQEANPYGWILPISYVHTLRDTNWTVNTSFIIRNNAEQFSLPGAWQAGGLVLVSYQRNRNLTYKAGLYYNREAFGNFFIPLLGIDWRPHTDWRLWGTLPGTLSLEKKLNANWYTGAAFRAITNSYQLKGDRFMRIEDNILSVFIDYYVQPNWVLNADLGHSFFRRIRTGARGAGKNYLFEEKINDNLFFKLSVAYRLRLDKGFGNRR